MQTKTFILDLINGLTALVYKYIYIYIYIYIIYFVTKIFANSEVQ